MLCVLAYHPGDQSQAARLADWIAELGDCKNHDLLLIRDTRVTQVDGLMIRQAFEKSFRRVATLDYQDVYTGRKWSEGGSAFAANDMFQTAAKHIYANTKQPYLWIEPDVVPMRAGWLDEIAAEYAQALQTQRVFLGDLVTPDRRPGIDVVTHMSGIAVYPADCYTHFGEALIAGAIAWDVAAANQIVPQMATSDLILHVWKHPPFANWAEVQRDILDKKPRCCLFHADKAGSLIQLLRERNLPVPVLADHERASGAIGARESTTKQPTPTGVDESPAIDGTPRGGQFTCDIFEFRNGALLRV